jgi:thymidylate synthase (FAD)
MHNVEIEIFRVAKTEVDRAEVRRWLDFIGVSPEFEIPDDQEVTDPALLVALAAKRCYMSFEAGINPNVTRIRRDWTEYLDNVLKSGHGSCFEHCVFTFAIENVSRVFTGEMNRHRAGVGISEGSMRYIRYKDMPWWRPEFLSVKEEDGPSIADKKRRTLDEFNAHFQMTEDRYARLQDIWKEELAVGSKFKGKKQVTSLIRRIIPMGVATGGVWTMNARAVRHILALRASEAAEEEICHVFGRVGKMMVESQPMIFGDFKQVEGKYWRPEYVKV